MSKVTAVNMYLFSILGLLSLFGCLNCSFAYIVTVDAHAEECFYEIAVESTKMGLIYEIVEGGFLDIDIKISGPDGQDIGGVERESSGKITFSANSEGKYTYCFSNRMSTLTPKVVMFNLDVEEPHELKDLEHEGNQEKLKRMIDELSKSLFTIKQEQDYMKVRDKIHRTINDNTNSRVVLWAIFEAAVLGAMTVGQIYYLKRFFEVRRVV